MKTARWLIIGAIAVSIVPLYIYGSRFKVSLPGVAQATWGYSGRVLGEVDYLGYRAWDYSQQVTGRVSAGLRPASRPTSRELADQEVIEIVSQQAPDLAAKFDSTGEELDLLSLNFQKAVSQLGVVGLTWESLDAEEAVAALDEVIHILESDKQLVWLSKAWGWPSLIQAASQVARVKENLMGVRQIALETGVQPVVYLRLTEALKDLESAQKRVGDSGDAGKDETAYGQLQRVRVQAAGWDTLDGQLAGLLAGGSEVAADQLATSVSQAAASVLELSQIPHSDSVLDEDLKDRVIDLTELVAANKDLLAVNVGEPVVRTWMVENPLTVKTVIGNPVKLSARGVTVKYYLPGEIGEKDIIARDLGLEVKYDSEKKRYYVAGELAVAAADTRVVNVQIADLWRGDEAEGGWSGQSPQQRIAAFRQARKVAGARTEAGGAGGRILGIVLIVGGLAVAVKLTPRLLTTYKAAQPRPTQQTLTVPQLRSFSETGIASADL